MTHSHYVRALAALMFLGALTSHRAASAEVMAPELPETGGASAADRATARAAYDDAAEAYGAGRLEDALAAADRAWVALPNASTALIRATILGDMKRDEEAFEAYLLAADLSPTADETSLVNAGLARHGGRSTPPMGWLVVTSVPDGAQAQLDGVVFVTPRTVGLSAGKHTLEVAVDGYLPGQFTVTARAGRGGSYEARLQHPAGIQPPTEEPVGPAREEEEEEEREEPATPAVAKLPHQKLQLRPFFAMGFPGKAKISLDDGFGNSVSDDTDLLLAWGGGFYLDIPLRQLFAFGVEVSVGTWNTQFHDDNELGPNIHIDLAFVPRFRVTFGRVAEAYLSIPIGLSVGIDDTLDLDTGEPVKNVGPGAYFSLLLGAKFYVGESFGIFVEGGWAGHLWLFATDPTTTWTARHGVLRTGVAFLF
ncbi:MAG: PEGA domain-containing protein [Deltaproteobacteria bacterium]|nr:PEGA domain-containing protein [Deltaproteobacteria bacterium]